MTFLKMADVDLEEVDLDLGLDDLDFHVISETQDTIEDTRDYTDKCFKRYSPVDGSQAKSIRKVICSGSEDPSLTEGEIGYCIGYKKASGRGRRHSLANTDIIYIDAPAGPIKIPANDLKRWAKALLDIDAAIHPKPQAANDVGVKNEAD